MPLKPIIAGTHYQDGSLKPIIPPGFTRAGGIFRPTFGALYQGAGNAGSPPVNTVPPSISSDAVREVTVIGCPGQVGGSIDASGFDIDSADGVKTIRINDTADVNVSLGPDATETEVAAAVKSAIESTFPDLWTIDQAGGGLTFTDNGIGDRTNAVQVGDQFLIVSITHLQVVIVGATLTRVEGTWTDADTISGIWQHDQGTGTWVDIAGETGATYEVEFDYDGENIRYYETATNGAGSTSEPSNELGPVEFGLQAWFDASQIVGLSDNDPVDEYPDESGNGNDATQADSGKQPTFQTNEYGSLPTVQTDGNSSAHYLEIPATLALAITGDFTIYCVIRSTEPIFQRMIFSRGNAGDDGWGILLYKDGSGHIILGVVVDGNGFTADLGEIADNTGIVVVAQRNGASITGWIDGVQGATTSVGSGSLRGTGTSRLFCDDANGSGWTGDCPEFLITNEANPEVTVDYMTASLTSKWSLGLLLFGGVSLLFEGSPLTFIF